VSVELRQDATRHASVTVLRGARVLDMAQEAEDYWQPSLIPVIWDFEGTYYGYALDTSGSSGFRVLHYAEVTSNETDPIRGAGREVTDADRQPDLCSEFGQLRPPDAVAVAVGAARVRSDQQPRRHRIASAGLVG
jgi:hypothetical protein